MIHMSSPSAAASAPCARINRLLRAMRRAATCRLILLSVLLALPVAGATGCADDGVPGMRSTAARRGGGGRPVREIVRTINANAARLDRALWSNNVDVTTRFHDEKGKVHTFDLEGSLLYRAPMSLRLDLAHGLGERVMQVGSNNEEYWVWIAPEVRRMWWGYHRNSGRECARRLIVQPSEVICALGLSGLPRGEPGLIGPMRLKGKTHDILQYWRLNEAGEYQPAREYRVDRSAPHLVRLVVFRDDYGDFEVTAYLDEYAPAWQGGPLIPHLINVKSHRNGDEFTLSIKGTSPMPDAKINPTSFQRPRDRLPAEIGNNIEQVDKNCSG